MSSSHLSLEALLGREPLEFDSSALGPTLCGQSVLVTGAAGSIGAEICRQIARYSPGSLILFDNAETPLFEIDRELRAAHHGLNLQTEIGDITRPNHVKLLFGRHHPAIVFHAAAYKHVSMMELHPFASVENNIFGTLLVAEAAIEHGATNFVLISSDKAVRPTSMMGATKRVAEMLIRTLQQATTTRLISVRFGNVLGSSGSVVPIFAAQIAAGGPVTVTHPEMQRYFMTIPEATELVLHSFLLGAGGEIFLLDMGKPIPIVHLAERMIRLSGFEPGKEIKVEFTGIRPGEKLFEDLNLETEDLITTSHERVKCYRSPQTLTRGEMDLLLIEFEQLTTRQDRAGLIKLLTRVIPDYTPDLMS